MQLRTGLGASAFDSANGKANLQKQLEKLKSSIEVKAKKEAKVKRDEYFKALDFDEYRGMMLGPTGEAALEAYAKMMEESASRGESSDLDKIADTFAQMVKIENAKTALGQLQGGIKEKV